MADTERKEGDQEEFRSTHAIRDAIPTRRHAEMLFEMVVDHLGESAWIETWNGETTRTLFRRDAPGSKWVLPWPLLSVTRGGREGPSPVLTAVPGVYEEPKPRPGPAPKIRDLGAGSVDVQDGPHKVSVAYGKDGRWFECTRSHSPDALGGVLAELAKGNAPPVELVASFVAGLDIARHGTGRVHLPVPLPGGAKGVWNGALFAIRDALFHERIPRSARWIVADGWQGKAIAWGASRETAMEAWKGELARVRPFPEKPAPPPGSPPESSMESFRDGNTFGFRGTLVGPRSDVPWVEPTLENSPAGVLQIGEFPPGEPAFGGWTWLVGQFGNVVPAALRLEKGGFTLVGDRLLERLDLGTLEDQLAAAERDEMPRPEVPPEMAAERPKSDCVLRTYRLVDEKTGDPVKPMVAGKSWRKGFKADTLDGDWLRWSVLRLRPERG